MQGCGVPSPVSRSASSCSQARRLGRPVSGSLMARCERTFSLRRAASRCRRSRTISARSKLASRTSRGEQSPGSDTSAGAVDADRDDADLTTGQQIFVEVQSRVGQRLVGDDHIDVARAVHVVGRADLAASRGQRRSPIAATSGVGRGDHDLSGSGHRATIISGIRGSSGSRACERKVWSRARSSLVIPRWSSCSLPVPCLPCRSPARITPILYAPIASSVRSQAPHVHCLARFSDAARRLDPAAFARFGKPVGRGT